jgi:hypothetical protein
MTGWLPCGSRFVTGDVVRWAEPIWKRRTYKTEKGKQLGTRLVTATVERCNEEWAVLRVEPGGCILRPFDGYQGVVGKEHMVAGEIRRRKGPIGQGEAYRALCGDESARSQIASIFFRPEPEAIPQPAGRQAWRPAPKARTRGGGSGRRRASNYVRGRAGK